MNTRDGLSLAVIAAASVLSTAVADEDLYWAGGPTGYWDDADTWTNASHEATVPGKKDDVYIQSPEGYTVTVKNTTKITNLNIACDTTKATKGTLVIESGADLTATSVLVAGIIGAATGSDGMVIQNDGRFTVNGSVVLGRVNSSRIGRYYMSGGTLTCISGSSLKGLWVGGYRANGYFCQSGGSVSANHLLIPHQSGDGSFGCYETSGGTLTVSTLLRIGTVEALTTGSEDCDFKVIGSTPLIDISGDLQMNAGNGMNARLTALIDNGGVSPIRVTGAASTVSLAGEFVAGVAHGVAFTATNAFDVITGAPSISGNFSTFPDASLWTTEIVENGGLSTFKMALAEAGCKGTLTGGRTEMQGLAIATAAEAGYVKVNAKNVGKPMPVRLAIDPGAEKTIDDFVDFLGDAGIEVLPSDKDGYDVMFMVTPSESSSYIVWDLSSFAPDATVSAVSVGNPGPALRIMLN